MSSPTTTRTYYLPKRGSFSDLTIKKIPLSHLKESEVLVKIEAVSVQYRDLLVANGHYPGPVKDQIVPCSDAAGVVVAVGSEVKKWKKGDRVCASFALAHYYGDVTPESQQTALGAPIDGVLAEHKIFPDQSLVRIPDHLSYEEASTLPCAGVTAYNALTGPRPLKAGETVLVLGTGGVSIFALQFAIASGARVIATSSSDDKLAVAKKLGAHHLINYKKTPNWDEEVLKITGGRGVDHVIEVGGPGTLAKSINSIRVGGNIHVIGFLDLQPTDLNIVTLAIFKAFDLRGVQVGSIASFEEMNRLISVNQIKPVVDKTFPFEQAQQAFEHLAAATHVGKVVIKVGKN